MSKKQADIFQQLSATFESETVRKWTEMAEKWEADPKAPNPYDELKSASTLQDIRLELAEEESAQNAANNAKPRHKVTLTGFLTMAFELEDRQYKLQYEISQMKGKRTSKQLADLEDKRNGLLRQIHNWREAQLVYMPHVGTLLGSILGDDGGPRPETAENISLYVPSSLPAEIRSLPEMKVVCEKEQRLREAQAEDTLSEIRRLRRVIQGLWQFKKFNVSGTGNRPNTRMLTLYNHMNHKVQRHAHRYRTARGALLSLDSDGRWSQRLKELRNDDIKGPAKEPEERSTSNGRYEPSWIWLMPRANVEPNPDEASREFNDSIRVEWAKTRARMKRWGEELVLVQEEMRRVLAFFEWKVKWWKAKSEERASGNRQILHGVRAYGMKQASIMSWMAAKCAVAWFPQLEKRGVTPSWGPVYSEQIAKAAKARKKDNTSTASSEATSTTMGDATRTTMGDANSTTKGEAVNDEEGAEDMDDEEEEDSEDDDSEVEEVFEFDD